jgi:ABC-type glycerol-3-phosphate transport system permease component
MNRKVTTILVVLATALIALWSVFPLYWTTITSFKTDIDIYTWPPSFFPNPPTLEWWVYTFSKELSGRTHPEYYMNSVYASLVGLIFCLIFSIPAAYSLARFTFRGREDLAFLILTFRFLPPASVVIPIFIFYRFLHLLDTPIGLGLIYGAMSAPIAVWVLRSYFIEVPPELEESYMLDGYSRWTAVRKVMIPLAAPGIVAVSLLIFALCWGEFLFAVFLTSSPIGKTVPVGIAELVGGERGYEWQQIGALTVAGIIPMIIAFTLIRKYLARGLTLGAVR